MNNSWDIRDRAGDLVAVHQRIDLPDGSKRMIWLSPDGLMGLGGTPVSELPLYRSERIGEATVVVVVCEGEKAADAVAQAFADRAPMFEAVGTVTGAASTPGRRALSVLAGMSVVLWPDADDVGRAHMRRIASLIKDQVLGLRMIDWPPGTLKGADAADLSPFAIKRVMVASRRV